MRTEPLMDFTYSEGPEGTLRPDIQVNGQPSVQEIGRAWKTYMHGNYPQRVSEMLMEGTFHTTMQAVDEEAENHKESLIQALLAQNPYPPTEGTVLVLRRWPYASRGRSNTLEMYGAFA